MTNKELYRKLRNYSGPNKKIVKAYIKGYEMAKRDGLTDIATENLYSAYNIAQASVSKSHEVHMIPGVGCIMVRV